MPKNRQVRLIGGPLHNMIHELSDEENKPNDMDQRSVLLSDKTNLLDLHWYMSEHRGTWYYLYSESWDDYVIEALHYYHCYELLLGETAT